MDWLYPTYAWGLLAVGAAAYALWRAERWWRRAREAFGDRSLTRQLMAGGRPRFRAAKAVLVVAALTLLVVSLMGPRLGTQVRTVERRGVDLVVALDVSASMRARDVAPSRLRRARKGVRDLVGQLSGDRVGLVLFAGTGFLQCPLTTDYGAFRLFLDVATPDQIPTPGTNLETALDAGLQAFETARPPADSARPRPPDEQRARVLLVVSDGENHVGDLASIRERATDAGVTLFTAGVGTQEGAQIPVLENGRQVDVKRTARGEIVRTRLNEDVLTRLAGADGAYFRVGPTASALSDVPAALRQLETAVLGTERFASYRELFQWPLALALLLLAVETCLPARRLRPENRPPGPAVQA